MAVSYNFDTKYYERVVDGTSDNNGYRIIIGDKTEAVTDSSTELELVSPGMTLEWQGGQDLAKNSIMGSALSFTAILTDDQLDTWEDYMTSLNEVMSLLYSSTTMLTTRSLTGMATCFRICGHRGGERTPPHRHDLHRWARRSAR